MDNAIANIPVVTVSYNSPDLIEALLRTFRQFYPNKVYVIDGSRPEIAAQIAPVTARFPNVEFIPFGYNIHHGPGMTWAIENLPLSGQVLFLDSDVEIKRAGFLESLQAHLAPGMWGVGGIQQVNEQGYDRPDDGAVAYLHPACMLVNIDVVRQWPLPIKHGAPLITTMLALHRAGRRDLIGHVDWVKDDFHSPEAIHYIRHPWQGTVKRTGGYHYDLPSAGSEVNAYLLHFMPADAQRVVDVGCGDGTFAKAYRARFPIVRYTGIEKDAQLADLARPHCDYVFHADVEAADWRLGAHTAGADCWVLGDVLSQVRDPAALLAMVRRQIAPGGKVVLSIRNSQHWSVFARLALGDLHYRADTPVAPGDLHLFTRATILDLLRAAGFEFIGGSPVVRDEPGRDAFLPAIRALAQAGNTDGELAVQDAQAWQFVIVAQAA
ncbi:Glycosyl transferase family 2 [Massilia sp. PDC64]|nr:bifunctional glycosyltransferase/class I SAM-dependent methyltransferase [Massilia sp. PDC64]SDE01271.1 Glycosyl transferase family 2 [Massilia sp. PDC64]